MDSNIVYTGIVDPRLHTLKEVVMAQSKIKQSFPTKSLFALRIPEEALQVNRNITVVQSDLSTHCVLGDKFLVVANKNLCSR